MDFLSPTLHTDAAIRRLRTAWSGKHSVRIEGALSPAPALALRDALSTEPHEAVSAPPENFAYQYWRRTYQPEDIDSPMLAAFGQWLHRGFVEWVSAWTGLPLKPHPAREVTATLFTYGCYLDLHNDRGYDRSLAFVFGLTEAPWPPDEGGHLEFCTTDEEGIVVAERRPPGWATLDLFDVAQNERFHRVPILTVPRARRAVSGWLFE